MWHDARSGARILWHAPGLSAAVVVLIALVIGGNATVYSAVRGLLTAPARGVEAGNLLGIGQVSASSARFDPFTSYPNYRHFAAHATTMHRLTAWVGERFTVGVDDGTYAVFGASVTTGFFETLGVRVAPGRRFDENDDRRGQAGLVAIISERLWRERFRHATDIVGRHMVVNSQPVTIVGVAAPGFLGASLTPGEDLWIPLEAFHDAMGSRALLHDPNNRSALVAGQLAPGRTRAEARADIETLSRHWRSAYPDDNEDRRATVFDYSATAFLPVAELGPRFLAIFSIVTVLTLLVVSANVANLLLARAVVRQRETAVRRSLGASRGRIVWMLMAEGAALAAAAWASASVLAWWVSRLLASILPPARQGLLVDLRSDWHMVVYALGLAFVATIAFTLAPAVRTWRQPVLPWLKAGEQAIAAGRSRLANTLLIVQLAIAVVLLTSAGLGYRSLTLLRSDVGFAHENLLLITVRTDRAGARSRSPLGGAPDAAVRAANLALLERIRERLLGVHDVESVTYAPRVPGPYLLTRVPIRRPGQDAPVLAMRRPVGPHYLRVLGLSVATGRELDERDRHGATATAVINESLAGAMFPGQSPLGQVLQIGDERDTVEVIGVAPNALYDGPSRDPRPAFVFLAEQQFPGTRSFEPTFVIRHRGRLETVAPDASKAVAEVDAAVPIVAVRSMTAQLETVTEIERVVTTLLLVFAVVSLGIAALGQYAIATFNMRQRTRDFGVRLALGASPRRIQHDVVREALHLGAIGLGFGFAASAIAGLALQRLLAGVTPADPITYAGVLAVLALTSVAASYLPAWHAGRVNVVDALRHE